MVKLLLGCIIFIMASSNLAAQDKEQSTKQKGQITFAYPMGSGGTDALAYSNSYSINILYGLNGGVDKFEIGSLFNFNNGNVQGLQMSGISNINTGYSAGFLVSGVSNIFLHSSSGFLLSGGVNLSKNNSHGLQLAPANIVSGQFKGLQIGVFNYTGILKGTQFGIFNCAESSEKGLPIGLFSIVRDGFYKLELTAGESIFTNLNYKMGVEEFYTIFKSGFSTFKSKPVYTLGLGFGSQFSLSEHQKMSVDLSLSRITYDNKWDSDKLNMLSKVDVTYEHDVTENVSLLIGPSLNFYLSEEKANGKFETLNVLYSIYTNESSDSKFFGWIGMNAGVSLNL